MTKPLRTHYHILSVTPRATDQQVREAYLRLAVRYHPDRNNAPAARRQFALINRAYAMLKTRPQRKAYNNLLRQSGQLTQNTPGDKSEKELPGRLHKLYAGLMILKEIFWPFALRRRTDHV